MARAKRKPAGEAPEPRRRGGQKPASAKAKSRKSANGNANTRPAAEIADAIPQAASTAELVLPDCLDSAAASNMKDMLLQRRGGALVVDASQVRRVGAQSLQVLIAAARTWQADGHPYTVTNASSELLDTIALIGLSREDLMLEGSSP